MAMGRVELERKKFDISQKEGVLRLLGFGREPVVGLPKWG